MDKENLQEEELIQSLIKSVESLQKDIKFLKQKMDSQSLDDYHNRRIEEIHLKLLEKNEAALDELKKDTSEKITKLVAKVEELDKKIINLMIRMAFVVAFITSGLKLGASELVKLSDHSAKPTQQEVIKELLKDPKFLDPSFPAN